MNENFRQNLANQLKEAPREEREGILEKARSGADYWKERVSKLGQTAEWSEDRTELAWDSKNVFHGTTIPDIEALDYAEESTIGNKALYFTTEPGLAMGYAKLRSHERDNEKAYLYDVNIKNVKMQNWAQQESVDLLGVKLREHINGLVERFETENYESLSEEFDLHVKKDIVLRALAGMHNTLEGDELTGGNIKMIAQGVRGIFFQDFVEKEGFDGVITVEGGDDPEFTATPGISVVLYNKDKVSSHKPHSLNIA